MVQLGNHLSIGAVETIQSPARRRDKFVKMPEKGNPGLGGYPPDVLKMESAAIICSSQCATLLREIGLTVSTFGEKPV
jgi:hypothetical protein